MPGDVAAVSLRGGGVLAADLLQGREEVGGGEGGGRAEDALGRELPNTHQEGNKSDADILNCKM